MAVHMGQGQSIGSNRERQEDFKRQPSGPGEINPVLAGMCTMIRDQKGEVVRQTMESESNISKEK